MIANSTSMSYPTHRVRLSDPLGWVLVGGEVGDDSEEDESKGKKTLEASEGSQLSTDKYHYEDRNPRPSALNSHA